MKMKVPEKKRTGKSTKKTQSENGDSSDTLNATKKRFLIGILLAWLGLVLIIAAVFWPKTDSQKSSANPSNAVQDACSTSDNITYKCYKDELTKITNEQGPEQAMTLVKNQYDKVSYVKTECHQLTHVIGRAALDKYQNVADTYAHGDQYCWSGYYHGAMEGLAISKGYDYLVENANSICAPIAAKERGSFYHYNCVHGMGHGYMFVKDGDLFASLKSCDSITDSWERTSCYGGVFMQNIMNEQTPDKDVNTGSKFLKADKPMYPCTDVEYKYKDQCYLMQTSYALSVVGYDFKKVFKMCAEVDSDFTDTCYTSLGRDASGSSVSDVEKTRSTCLLGPTEEAKKFCVNGAAKDFVSYFHSDTQAKQLCDSLPADLSTYCMDTVTSYYSSF